MGASTTASRVYARREPEKDVLYRVVRPTEVKQICARLGYPTEPPPIAPARAPPQADLWDQRLAG